MNVITVFILLIGLHSSAEEDSARVYKMNEIVVTSTRTAVAVERLPSAVQVIDSGALFRSNGSQLADKVKNASGIAFRSYGGNGSLQTVSVRGMGSDYTLILLDGQRFTTFQIGTVDLGIFSMHDVERIEIARGGNSSMYGADAIGGVINIITKRPSGKLSASALAGLGSFGTEKYQLSAGGGTGDLSIHGSIDVLRASNGFPFWYRDGGTMVSLVRQGADFSMVNSSLSARSIVAENVIASGSIRYSDAERGQPLAVTSRFQNNVSRLHDRDVFVLASTEFKYSEQMVFTLPITFHRNRQTFSDPRLVISGVPVSSFYENNNIGIAPLVTYTFSDDHRISAGSDFASASITSNEVFAARRKQFSWFASSQHHLPFDIILYPSVRYDMFSDVQGDISPKIGVNMGVLDIPVVRIRASYGKNYRVPTFNDLYWIDGGNPNLNPEHSLSLDAGIIGGFQAEEFNAGLEISYFSINAKDKIVWLPGAYGRWSPKNLQSVMSTGIELSATLNVLDNLLTAEYHHQFTRAVKTSADGPNDQTQNKQQPYVPQETATFEIGSSIYKFSANLQYSFTSFRYESPDNDPRYILPSYGTVDVNVSYAFVFDSFSMTVRNEINNLFNEEYQLVTGFPIPLRNYLFSAEVSFN
ncbi:MAG: TonB-dependent receptor [Bacteroidota bacterium]|jgi:outer membrane cobalamin receptor